MASIRSNLTGDGAWHQIGTGPATVQLIAPDANGVEVMVEAATVEPTGSDGMVLSSTYSVHTFTLAQAIWAQVVQSEASALVAVQPEAS